MDKESGGEDLRREQLPVLKPEQSHEHDATGDRAAHEGRKRTSEPPIHEQEERSERDRHETESSAENHSDRASEQSRSDEPAPANISESGGAPDTPGSAAAPVPRRDQGRPRFPRRDRGRGRRGPVQRLPERPGGGERSERRAPDQSREQHSRDRERERPPVTAGQSNLSPIAQATQEVDRIRQVLEGVLQDMERVLGQLELAESEQTATEQEIESLRRSLESLHRSSHSPRG